MKEIELEFISNANGTGKMTFKRVKAGVTPSGKNVYIYSRTKMDGTPFTFEVIVPLIKKAGTYKLPLPKDAPPGTPNPTITYTEDFEEYPGAAKFGFTAWDCNTLPYALQRFNELISVPIEIPEVEEDETPEVVESVPKHHGRQKGPRPVLTVPPVGELFSVKELAAKNNVAYIVADVFRKEALGKTIRFVKTERRNPKGPETKLYTKLTSPS
jgi:hypothetical protein